MLSHYLNGDLISPKAHDELDKLGVVDTVVAVNGGKVVELHTTYADGTTIVTNELSPEFGERILDILAESATRNLIEGTPDSA
jgi:hydroxymethylpyrimidine pyrophosphatase-like HAD family hydrolase